MGSYGFDSNRSGWGKHAVRWVISTLIWIPNNQKAKQITPWLL